MIVLRLTGFFKQNCRPTLQVLSKKNITTNCKPPWNIVFFGTDDFSLCSLKALNSELKKGAYLNNLEVVTSIKTKNNSVYKYAKNEKLEVHDWPLKLLDKKFDVGVVVSFGHLIPEDVINRFHYGILNIHASLLPRWRGAAPIIHAIANEDSQTGVSVIRIQPKQFDIGDIVKQQAIDLPKNVTMIDLYNMLAELGASLIVNCLYQLPECLKNAVPQSNTGISYAPKVSSYMCHVNWREMSAQKVCALGRAFYGLYPLTTSWNNIPVKLYDVSLEPINNIMTDNFIREIQMDIPGFVIFHKDNGHLYIHCADSKYICVKKVGILGKKPMTAMDFNNGYIKKELIHHRFFK